MPDFKLTKEEYDAVERRVAETAPDGLTQEQFYKLVDAAVHEAEQGKAREKFLLGYEAEGPQPENWREYLPQLGALAGGAILAPAAGALLPALAIGAAGAGIGGAVGETGRQIITGDIQPRRIFDEGVDAALGGAAGTAVARGLGAVGKRVADWAVPRLLRADLKPLRSALQRYAGASRTGVEAQAKKLMNDIRKWKIRNPDQAEDIIKQLESRIQAVVGKGSTTVTDYPQRAQRYLGHLGSKAGYQGSPKLDLEALSKEVELLEQGPLFKDFTTLARGPGGQTIPAAGQGNPNRTVTQLKTVTTRVPRTDVNVGEALGRARGTTQMQTKGQYGSLKGVPTEAQKMIDRAGRHAAKIADARRVRQARLRNPKAKPKQELAPLLREQGEVIRIKDVMDKAGFRQGNREALSPFAGAAAAAETAQTGKLPIIGSTMQFLRDNQSRLGFGIDSAVDAVKGRWGPSVANLLTIPVAMSGDEPTLSTAEGFAGYQTDEEIQALNKLLLEGVRQQQQQQ